MGRAGLTVRQIEDRALAAMPLRPYADPHAAYAHGFWSWEDQKSVNISLGQIRVLAHELMNMAILPEDVIYRIQ